jgi:hypothetical protein
MKHIKLFESFEDIDSICKKYNIKNYTINPDGSVDVDGDVNLYGDGLVKLPLKFGRVSGDFDCCDNPVREIYKLLKNHKDFMDSLDWDYIRGNKIVKSRFKDACEEVGIKIPKSIKGYKYI